MVVVLLFNKKNYKLLLQSYNHNKKLYVYGNVQKQYTKFCVGGYWLIYQQIFYMVYMHVLLHLDKLCI